MRAYLSVFRMRWKMELQYRGAVVGGFICQVFFGLILVALYRALYAGKPQAMPLSSVTTYVWLQQAFFRMLLSSDDDLREKIRTGNIAYDLCRPVQMYGYYYARIAAQKLLGSLLRAAPMLVFALLLPKGWGLAAPASFPALLASVAGLLLGLLCVCALENVTMAFTMRTLDPRGIQAMLNLLMTLLAGNILPLTLFPDSWQRILTLLPHAQILDAPIRLYTGERALSDAAGILALQAVWIVIIVAFGLWLWQKNQKRLIVQGG
ncbi:MAG: ABC-2 family transporter protein [Clostridia bacterium]|nr:ABC-2 family transporter protein [Clostridia bacterium]